MSPVHNIWRVPDTGRGYTLSEALECQKEFDEYSGTGETLQWHNALTGNRVYIGYTSDEY